MNHNEYYIRILDLLNYKLVNFSAQRETRLTHENASNIITSILRDRKINSFRLKPVDINTYIVAGGQHRIEAIKKFFNNEFPICLSNSRWNNLHFKDLKKSDKTQFLNFRIFINDESETEMQELCEVILLDNNFTNVTFSDKLNSQYALHPIIANCEKFKFSQNEYIKKINIPNGKKLFPAIFVSILSQKTFYFRKINFHYFRDFLDSYPNIDDNKIHKYIRDFQLNIDKLFHLQIKKPFHGFYYIKNEKDLKQRGYASLTQFIYINIILYYFDLEIIKKHPELIRQIILFHFTKIIHQYQKLSNNAGIIYRTTNKIISDIKKNINTIETFPDQKNLTEKKCGICGKKIYNANDYYMIQHEKLIPLHYRCYHKRKNSSKYIFFDSLD